MFFELQYLYLITPMNQFPAFIIPKEYIVLTLCMCLNDEYVQVKKTNSLIKCTQEKNLMKY